MWSSEEEEKILNEKYVIKKMAQQQLFSEREMGEIKILMDFRFSVSENAQHTFRHGSVEAHISSIFSLELGWFGDSLEGDTTHSWG